MADPIAVEEKVKADVAALKHMQASDPAAAPKEAEIIAGVKLLAMLAGQWIPDAWKPMVSIIVGAVLGAVSAWFVKPAAIPVPVSPPAIVVPAPPSPIVPPGPVVPPTPIVQPNKVIVYLVTAIPPAEITKLSPNISVDQRLWPVGSTYPWQGKSIPLPAMALVNAAGQVLDVAPYVAADVAAFLAKGGK